MKKVLRLTDEKSDKFWRVETADCAMSVNYGKTGTTGRYEIKEFDSREECEKNAEKLVAAKIKKGYREMPDFDEKEHFYFDDEETGLHPLTSHPYFRTYFSNEMYYDCVDEEAPFGSDEGNDAFAALQELLRKKPQANVPEFPKKLIEKDWELTYLPPVPNQGDEELRAQVEQKYNGLPGDQELLQSDQIILATALGQIKIMGRLDAELKNLAFASLERMERMYRLIWNWKEEQSPYHIFRMREDLKKFTAEENQPVKTLSDVV